MSLPHCNCCVPVVPSDQWAAANPNKVLVHRIEQARQVANRKRDDRQKRRDKVAAADIRAAAEAGR